MKNLNEFEIETLNTTVGTYSLIFVSKGDHDEHQITKNRIVLERFWGCEKGLQKAHEWLHNMERTDKLENENCELRAEITKKSTTGERIKYIFAKLEENRKRLSDLRQQLYPSRY